MPSDKLISEVAKAFRKAGGDTKKGSSVLGITRRTFQKYAKLAREAGILECEGIGSPHENKAADGVQSLVRDILDARPKTWWDALSSEEREALLKIKRNHLAQKHRIGANEIFDRCKTVIKRLAVGRETFRKWLTDAETQEPIA